MPLRPFPYQLSIGTDIIHVSRIRAIFLKDLETPGYLTRFLKRFLTPQERNEFSKIHARLKKDQPDISSRHLAGRWAAKEAVIKAVSWRRLGFHDVVIQRATNGRGVFAIVLDDVPNKRKAVDEDITIQNEVEKAESSRHANSVNISDIWPSTPSHEILMSQENHLPNRENSVDASLYHDALSLEDGNVSSAYDLQNGPLYGQVARISISHDGEYATAVCLAAEGPTEGDVGGEAAAREPS